MPTDQQVGELDRRLTRLEPLVRRGGGLQGPPGEPGMVWRGDWDPGVTYVQGDAVSHNGSSWIAPDTMVPGTEPGVPLANDPLLTTVRGVPVYAHARLASSSPQTYTIDAGDSFNTFDSGKKSECVLIDRTGTSSHAVTLVNDHATDSLRASMFTGGGSQIGTAQTVAPGASFTFASVTSGFDNDDVYIICWFNAGSLGSFRASVSNPGALVPPPPLTPLWDLLAEKGDPGATSGDKTYVHTQGTPSSTWVVVHNLAKFVSVDVVDTGDSVVIPSVHYDSSNQVTLTFGSPTTGKAYVN